MIPFMASPFALFGYLTRTGCSSDNKIYSKSAGHPVSSVDIDIKPSFAEQTNLPSFQDDFASYRSTTPVQPTNHRADVGPLRRAVQIDYQDIATLTEDPRTSLRVS